MFVKLTILLGCIKAIDPTFICSDGFEIPTREICDGKVDCPGDPSDESRELCVNFQCEKDQFRCRYGGCIPKSLRCNKNVDCIDASDENHCDTSKKNPKCRISEFRCSNDKCIPFNLTCDNSNDCTDNSDEDVNLCDRPICRLDKFKCKSGGCIETGFICDGNLDCPDGSDEEKITCEQYKKKNFTSKCPAVQSNGLHLTCQDPVTGEQPCGTEQRVGTIARGVCLENYESESSKFNETKSYCQFDGRWNSRFLKCKPVCGITEHIQPLIANGYPFQNWPWYAALYSSETGEYKFFCGGTLISEHIVITAAHCTWRKSSREILVAFAKYSSDLNVPEEHTQKRNVSKIVQHPNYYDIETNYGSDLAVLFLESGVVLTQHVRPACLDWDSKVRNFKGDLRGTVVGMGLTENNAFSSNLQGTELPIISTEDCFKNQRKDFYKYITYTSFCAGWMNGTGVCNGDSGGGLLIQWNDRWYLEGLVSISPRKKGLAVCDTNRLTIFTKVPMYLDWIREVVRSPLLGI